ncbi:MAG: hypothetical protein K9W44_12875 [Candidatus Lokiarchaeota archaeon]|nr:hypothetical protein [Candidatus Harpocratesius repetitus]
MEMHRKLILSPSSHRRYFLCSSTITKEERAIESCLLMPLPLTWTSSSWSMASETSFAYPTCFP